MSVTATAKRRRRQAAMGNMHVAKLGRRIYGKSSKEKSAARLRARIQREKDIQMRKGQSKK